jgi:hypothetical protein
MDSRVFKKYISEFYSRNIFVTVQLIQNLANVDAQVAIQRPTLQIRQQLLNRTAALPVGQVQRAWGGEHLCDRLRLIDRQEPKLQQLLHENLSDGQFFGGFQ